MAAMLRTKAISRDERPWENEGTTPSIVTNGMSIVELVRLGFDALAVRTCTRMVHDELFPN
eukprot:4828203-Amphidinium_carterae.1